MGSLKLVFTLLAFKNNRIGLNLRILDPRIPFPLGNSSPILTGNPWIPHHLYWLSMLAIFITCINCLWSLDFFVTHIDLGSLITYIDLGSLITCIDFDPWSPILTWYPWSPVLTVNPWITSLPISTLDSDFLDILKVSQMNRFWKLVSCHHDTRHCLRSAELGLGTLKQLTGNYPHRMLHSSFHIHTTSPALSSRE